jgi:hypothetical protein
MPTANGHGRGHGSSKKVLNLDSLGDDNEPTKDEIKAKSQLAEFTKLRNQLMLCQRCGKQIYCKVNKYGAHVTLTSSQVVSWAYAIVCELHYVI